MPLLLSLFAGTCLKQTGDVWNRDPSEGQPDRGFRNRSQRRFGPKSSATPVISCQYPGAKERPHAGRKSHCQNAPKQHADRADQYIGATNPRRDGAQQGEK